MGGGASKPVEKKSLQAHMLLLGAPSVGKSTIFRQMKLLYRDGFTDAERKRARIELRRNLIASLLKLDEIALEKGLNLGSNDAEESVTRLKMALADYNYDERDDENCVEALDGDGHEDEAEEVAAFPTHDVLTVFADPSIKQAYELVTKHEFEVDKADVAGRELVQTALPYVLERIERITKDDFLPTDADCLHLRRHTTSVERIAFECEIEVRGKMEAVSCTCTDIGGQAQEQTKWEEHAATMDFLVFVAAMSDFDRTLPDGTNSLDQQFKLLQQVLRAKCFSKANVIVLLNKSDMLGERLQQKKLSDFFPNFCGENNAKDAQQYFHERCDEMLNKVVEESGERHRQIQVLPTCALDTAMVNNVLTRALAASMCSTLMTYGLLS